MTNTDSGRTRAPRNSLNADLILGRALNLLDAKGVDGFSMRALADDLGVGTMALYTYFRGKDELLRAARDHVLSAHAPPAGAKGPWDERLRCLCIALYTLFAERPAILRLLTEAKEDAQQAFGYSAPATLERMASLLRESGMDAAECVRSCSVLVQYTIGASMRRLHATEDSRGASDRPGQLRGADLDAPSRRLRALGERLDPQRHPTLTEVLPEMITVRQDDAQQYAFGLDLFIAGLRGLAAQAIPGADATSAGDSTAACGPEAAG
ncbi:TetR/AcrR family transcriptional regulator [Streptomyces sp. NBC_00063]|uniref:TetR/AcrR family transcriptional regulator n=1 Tax=Streptomyces sp. NBC_00063 TaxID=2975638 RepID=UPI003D729352